MDLRVLNYYLVVAREENITKAAQLLHMTQPTLSRQLMQLEEELGVKLFQRGKHNIYLTQAGMLFRRRAQELVNLADKAKAELQQSDQELTGEIAIGCNESKSMNELADQISAFRQIHPLVKFTLRSGNNGDIREWLDQGTVDFGILVEPAEVADTLICGWGIRSLGDPGPYIGTPCATALRSCRRFGGCSSHHHSG